ncbi:MFS general substrate transporter [Lactarius psammicola]|nr:MFS general substrate transporter [Lactarius psammicola]
MSLTRFEDNHEHDEEMPFLPNQEVLPPLNPTRSPLPTAQISILLTAWLADSIISHSISPYLNQLVGELPDVGGDARKVGYYTGIIVRLTFSKSADGDQTACKLSLRYAADAATSVQWNRLSDRIGRKPVLLFCLVGTTLSILLFGASLCMPSGAVSTDRLEGHSRCLHGAMRGHSGVVKSMIAELTDETSACPRIFNATSGLVTRICSFSPLIGGVFSRPQDRWPLIFSHPFWADYPYFLPCLLAATFTCLSIVITGLYLEERSHLPLRSVLTKPVVITVANYAMLAFLDAVAISFIPLVWSTPVEYGGLNLSPASIGSWLSVYGSIGGVFQFLFFSHFVSCFGLRRVFVFSIVSCAAIYAIFPFENLAVMAGDGPNLVVWLLIVLQLSSWCIFDMGHCAINMYVSSAAPNKRSLGAVFGLSHAVASILSVVGPAADWLFAFSLTHNVLGGNFAYIVLLGALPKNTWARRGD